MGYPMTFSRFINRNGLKEGGYKYTDIPLPPQWAFALNLTNPGVGTIEQLREGIWPHLLKWVEDYQGRVHLLLGDLRRLEQDAVDERTICTHIARRTGVDAEIVATVLKEFMTW